MQETSQINEGIPIVCKIFKGFSVTLETLNFNWDKWSAALCSVFTQMCVLFVYICISIKEYERLCMCVFVSMCMYEHEWMSVCECVCHSCSAKSIYICPISLLASKFLVNFSTSYTFNWKFLHCLLHTTRASNTQETVQVQRKNPDKRINRRTKSNYVCKAQI